VAFTVDAPFPYSIQANLTSVTNGTNDENFTILSNTSSNIFLFGTTSSEGSGPLSGNTSGIPPARNL
jgi:hypothetical protein